jgi:predicted metal-dependent HD superfamily phosphohydrolase
MERNDMRDLRTAWRDLAGSGPDAVAVGEELLGRWSEPHRRYHTLSHLSAVLGHLDALGGGTPAVGLAAWYHDAVYWPSRSDNEEVSAALAASTLPTIGVADQVVTEVERLVLLTATHVAQPSDAEGALLCDADLAVLGASPAGYAAYRAAVRAEYAAVDDARWRVGRAAVLEGFLARSWIYATASGRHRWEAAARTNLASELAALD